MDGALATADEAELAARFGAAIFASFAAARSSVVVCMSEEIAVTASVATRAVFAGGLG
jgi:hypothetical protein